MADNTYIIFPGAFYHSKTWPKVPSDYVKAYVDLCFKVAHTTYDHNCQFGKVHLNKGEMVTSYRHLAEIWKYPLTKVYRIIKYLKNNNLITVQTIKRETEQGVEQFSLLKINYFHNTAEQPVEQSAGQDNNKNNNTSSKDEDIYRTKKFSRPTPEEVQAFLLQLHELRMTGEQFCNYYESVGWTVGRNKPMKSWKACVRTWINNMNRGLYINRNNERYISRQELAARQHKEFVEHIKTGLEHPDSGQGKLPF